MPMHITVIPTPIPYFKGKALGQDWLTTYKFENFADSKDWLSISQVNVERNLADLILRHFFPLAFFLLDFYEKKINKLITIWWQRQTSRDRTSHENKKVKLFHSWICIELHQGHISLLKRLRTREWYWKTNLKIDWNWVACHLVWR